MSQTQAIALRQRLENHVRAAFAAAGLDPALGAVDVSRRPELCQFQCNGAMAAAKAARRNPRELAGAVVAALAGVPMIVAATVEGPGFINLSASDEAIAEATRDLAQDPRLGVAPASPPRRILVDFGGPNVAKAMHVGHLRSSIIGDTLQRVLRFAGHEVVSDIHLGDWGLPMGMLIAEIERADPAAPWFAPGAHGPFPATSPVTTRLRERKSSCLAEVFVLLPTCRPASRAP